MRHIDRQTHSYTSGKIDRQRYRQIDRHTEQTDRHLDTGIQVDRQMNRHIEKYTDIDYENCVSFSFPDCSIVLMGNEHVYNI